MGNFISKLFGASKPETVTEKYARQDAEFRAKHPERFQPPAPQPQPAPAGVGGVKGLMGGSLTTNLQEREKAAGLKVGGMVRKKCVEGGEIEGPGGPTDDLVPIDASNGEFMIKASSAKILGEDVLEALNDLGDEPKDPKDDAAEDAAEGMKCGGKVKKMADGGAVQVPIGPGMDREGFLARNPNVQQGGMGTAAPAPMAAPTVPAPAPTVQPTPAAAPLAQDPQAGQYGHAAVGATVDQGAAMDRKLLAQSAADAAAKAPTTTQQQPTGMVVDPMAMSNRLLQQRNLQDATAQGLAAIPQDSQETYVPPIGPSQIEIPQLKAGGMVRQPKRMVGGGWTQENQAELDKRVTKIPAGGTAPAPDDLSQGTDFTRNVANTAMALPGVGGALAGAGVLASAVPSVVRGLSAAAPMASKGLGMAKTAAPYALPAAGFAALQAASGTDPVSQVTAKPAATGSTTTPGAPATPAMPSPAATTATAPADEFSNAAIAQRNPGGMVRKVGNSYSGSNITGDVSFQGADGNALPGRPGGGFMTYGGMSPEAIKSALTNPDGSAWSAGDNAIMAANMRDGVDQYRGTSRDPRNDPMNQPMTKDQRAARVRLAEVNSQDKRYAQANATEQEKLGMLRSEFTAKQTKDKQVTDLQNAYMNAKTPEEKDTYRQKMIALGLIKTNAPTYHPGSKVTDALGNQTITEGTVFNPDTQEVRVVGQQAKAVVPDAATARTQALAALKANPANKDEINKRLAAAGYQPI